MQGQVNHKNLAWKTHLSRQKSIIMILINNNKKKTFLHKILNFTYILKLKTKTVDKNMTAYCMII